MITQKTKYSNKKQNIGAYKIKFGNLKNNIKILEKILQKNIKENIK